MSKKRLKKVTEAGFIPGIYNYCDRWCQRCAQQSHCMSYVMGKRVEARGGFDFEEEMVRDDENIWRHLRCIFESTYEVLHELADERGMDVEDIYVSENIDRDFWNEEYEDIEQGDEAGDLFIETSDIIRMCLIYEELADECMEQVFDLLDERKLVSKQDEKETSDAIDVINWYVDVIQTKLRRALLGYFLYADSSRELQKKDDYNGSAKVSLIGIESTILAWDTVKIYFPDTVKDVTHLQVVLEQLVRDINKQFKEAHVFLRPGFEK